MFITIKYGNNQSLICNPNCAVINLMNNIRHKTGFLHSSLDLCDETGLLQDLEKHQMEYAHKHLDNPGTYILVEKENFISSQEHEDPKDSSTPTYRFTPLLEHYEELLPNFQLRFKEALDIKKAPVSKSSSPAGKFQRKKRSKYRNLEMENFNK